MNPSYANYPNKDIRVVNTEVKHITIWVLPQHTSNMKIKPWKLQPYDLSSRLRNYSNKQRYKNIKHWLALSYQTTYQIW